MENNNKKNNEESGRLLYRTSLRGWKPDDDLKEAIAKSWGLENINERSAGTRSGQNK